MNTLLEFSARKTSLRVQDSLPPKGLRRANKDGSLPVATDLQLEEAIPVDTGCQVQNCKDSVILESPYLGSAHSLAGM